MIRRPRVPTPRDRDNAVRLAVHASERVTEALRRREAAIRFALERGASPREVSEATGVPFAVVKRIGAAVMPSGQDG